MDDIDDTAIRERQAADGETTLALPAEDSSQAEYGVVPSEGVDPDRSVRTWIWMVGVAAFGLFLVFGSVPAHYWQENAAGTYYVPVQRGMQVLDIWRAQVDGLPNVSNQLALKVLFLGSVFAFLGLSVMALWLATVELWAKPHTSQSSPSDGDRRPGEEAAAPGVSTG